MVENVLPWINKRIADIEHQIKRGETYLQDVPNESWRMESWEVNAKGWREMLPPYRQELDALRAFVKDALHSKLTPLEVEKVKADRDEEWRKLLYPMSEPMTGAALATKVIHVLTGTPEAPVPEGYCCALAAETLMLSHDVLCRVWIRP